MQGDDFHYEMRQRGYCVFEEVVPDAHVEAVRESVLATVERHRHLRRDAPKQIGAVSGLINYDRSFAPYLADERLERLCSTLLGPEFRVSYNSSVVNWPGNDRGPWQTGKSVHGFHFHRAI